MNDLPIRLGRPARRGWQAAAASAVLGAILAAPAGGRAQGSGDADALLRLINQQRSAGRCSGASMPPQPPLRPVAALAAAETGADGRQRAALNAALRARGYAASRSLVIEMRGPRDAGEAMRLLASQHCAALASANYRDIGITRRGEHWRVLLADPLLSPALGSSEQAGRRVLELVNAARASPRRCGDKALPAAPPLAWNAALAGVALAHSRDMAGRGSLSHTGNDGSRAGERVRRQGGAWRTVGENIAAGQGSPEQVVADWVESPEHCVNLMARDFSEMGAAYAVDLRSSAVIYWTQVFGTPRAAPRSRSVSASSDPAAAAQAR